MYKLWMLLLGLNIFAFAGGLQAQSLSFEDVLHAVLQKHPDLAISQAQIKMRQIDSNQMDGALDMRYNASLGVSDETVPASSVFAATNTSSAFLFGQVIKPLLDGSTLIGSLNYNKAKLGYPSASNPAFQADPNPIYQHQIDLIYRYPLAMGSGNPSYTYGKEASRYDIEAARLNVAMLKEQLASQVIAAYFQLMLSDLSLKLAEDAVERARQLLTSQHKRERFGLIEKAERLQAEALLATRYLQQVQAIAAYDLAQTSLKRLMFQDNNIPLSLKPVAKQMQAESLNNMLDKAIKKRPVFKMLDAQYAAAAARLNMAKDTGKYQLDLVGQLGSRALDGGAGTAFAQGLTLNDKYISLSIEFSDVIDNKTSRYAIQRNVLLLENIQLEQKKTIEMIKTELANIVTILRSGEDTLDASSLQVNVEKKKFAEEMKRYKEGRSSTAIITQFEGDLRAAELRMLIQEVSLDQAAYQLALILGELSLSAEVE